MESKSNTIAIPYIPNETLCPFGLILPKEVVRSVNKKFPNAKFDGKLIVASLLCQKCRYFSRMDMQVVFCKHE